MLGTTPLISRPEITSSSLLNDSWLRSQCYGLDPKADDLPRVENTELADRLAHNTLLQQFSLPAVKLLAKRVADMQSVVVLSDASGLILNNYGEMNAMQKAQRFALAPGNLWSECGRGTNAIGTALAIDDGCEILGQQHYLVSNQQLYCAAMPLQAPNGHIAGVLDISGPAHYNHAHTLRWVKETAKQIEYLWMKQSLQPDQWLMSLHPQIEGLDQADELLLIFSDNVLMAANRAATIALGLSLTQIGSVSFQQLFPDCQQIASHFPLPLVIGGQQRYFFRLRAPVRNHHPLPEKINKARASTPLAENEKMLRLINAGISICLQGETGTGKEFVSRRLHQQSRWQAGKFVAINCAAIPESLIESELFGYQPGAFTGASKQGYIGKIREANGGVLFLDEIGDMPLALQTRLLRVLQEKEVSPLGASQVWSVNFAVICATHRNLLQCVEQETFREDLLYRLQEFSLTLPPLRDWPTLQPFILQLWREMGGEQRGIRLAPELLTQLMQAPWPGNIRQLQSLLKVLLALADDNQWLNCDDLPPHFPLTPGDTLPILQKHDEKLISETLQRCNGNISQAAQALGVARSTLYRRAARAKKSG